MTQHQVEIRTEGTRGQVLIDGRDIARSVTGLTFKAGIDGPPQLIIDLQLIDVTTVDSTETQVLLGDGVADTLKALGWTAPEDDG
ncbi:hypothetical protein [Streptomyces sp. NPDC001508]|uniref:hypothetical protein n=1 Tax=Streptomyces sp. NPDC001508 TaxID=3154656 RepID=UPI00331C2221